MQRNKVMAVTMVVTLIGSFSLAVSAHQTGHESRTVAQCGLLPSPERNACISCVKRPLKHHFHPDYPAGTRCRPDNGKP